MIEVIGRRASGQRLQERLDELHWERGERFLLVNWTGALQESGATVLNKMSRSNKLTQLIALQVRGLNVPPYALSERAGWLPRRAYHEQGRDFTSRRGFDADFWVEKIETIGEWRIHGFRRADGYRSIKACEKRIIPNFPNPHPWVRNHRLGWGQYAAPSPRPIREAALQALSALQLDFGAVDVGVMHDGTPVIFEVNTCPGLTGDTLNRYAEEIYAVARNA